MNNITAGNYSPSTLTPSTTYYYTSACYNNSLGGGVFSLKTTVRSFIYDPVAPTFVSTLDGNNTLVFDNLTWSLNISDDVMIAGFNITIDGVFLNETLLSQDFFIMNYSWDISNNQTGNHTISITACDAHTSIAIKNFNPKKDDKDKSLTYEGVSIRPKNRLLISDYDTTKSTDRYTFEFTPSIFSLGFDQTFIVEANSKITIANAAEGHLVIFDEAKWVDFVSDNPSIKVKGIKRISSTKVEVTVTNPDDDVMLFKSIGGLNCATVDYLFYKYGQTHDYNSNSIYDVNEEIELTLNLTGTPYDNTDIDIVLVYNNTKYSSISKSGTKIIRYATNIVTPAITGNFEEIAFHWEYNISTHIFNSTNESQTISNFLLTECGGAYNTYSLNISILNESDPTQGVLATSLEQTYQLFDSTGATYHAYNFSNTTTPLSNFSLCIFPNITVTSDFQIEYVYDDTYFSYFGYQINLSNVTKNLDLYVTDGTSQIIYTVKDTFDDEVEDIYITVEKFDVGTNSYQAVEVLKTDNDGVAIGRAVLYTAWYRFTLKYNGVTVLVDGPTKLTDDTKDFTVNLLGSDWFDKYNDFRDITYNLYWNNASKNFGLTWDDPTLNLQKICLRVENITNQGSVIIGGADSCSTSHSGTLLVNVGGSVDNQMFIATALAYVTGSAENLFMMAILEKSFFSEWRFYEEGSTGIGTFVAFILVLTLFFIGIWHPSVSIVLGLLGLLITRILGLYYISWPMFMAIVAIGCIVIYRVSRSK